MYPPSALPDLGARRKIRQVQRNGKREMKIIKVAINNRRKSKRRREIKLLIHRRKKWKRKVMLKERQKEVKNGKTEFLEPHFLRHSYAYPQTYYSYLIVSHITMILLHQMLLISPYECIYWFIIVDYYLFYFYFMQNLLKQTQFRLPHITFKSSALNSFFVRV